MNIKDCKPGQVVIAKGKRGTVMFVCKSTFTGENMIRVWPSTRPPKLPEDRTGYEGENFRPEDVELI